LVPLDESRPWPGAYNVIPGEVIPGLDLRDLDAAKIDLMYQKLVAEAAKASGTSIQFKELTMNVPAPTDPRIRQLIENSSKALGLSTRAREDRPRADRKT
jgi:beta-ureidopropionase / N-carbamoyl-L-amino-acid hydrolase